MSLEAYVPYRSFINVLGRAAEQHFACPDFGLRLAAHQGLEILGPVALIGRHAATVGDGLQGLIRYLPVYTTALGFALEPRAANDTRCTFSILATGVTARAQAEQIELGVTLRVFKILAGQRFRPLRVAFTHSALAPPATYRAFFDADVQFEQDHCGFDFMSDHLSQAIAHDDPLIRDLAQRYLESDAVFSTEGIASELKALVLRALPTGQCTIANIAHGLAVHPRTLQRRLAHEGVVFGDLVDAVRRDQAKRYLEETTMPISQLSALLGYSEPSSLSRACRAWFGVTPRVIRCAHASTARADSVAGRPGWWRLKQENLPRSGCTRL